MSLTHCPRHDRLWGSRSQIELELEINQPPLAHNSQLIAAQGEAIKGFGQQRLCTHTVGEDGEPKRESYSDGDEVREGNE
jgi:hypothetical protein